jgi:hypothetical protein
MAASLARLNPQDIARLVRLRQLREDQARQAMAAAMAEQQRAAAALEQAEQTLARRRAWRQDYIGRKTSDLLRRHVGRGDLLDTEQLLRRTLDLVEDADSDRAVAERRLSTMAQRAAQARQHYLAARQRREAGTTLGDKVAGARAEEAEAALEMEVEDAVVERFGRGESLSLP